MIFEVGGDRRLRSELSCDACNRNIADCICPDIDERLRVAATDLESNFIAKWCVGCNKYWARCRCAAPQFRIFSGGQQVDPRTIKNLLGQTVAETNPEIGYDDGKPS